MSEPAPTIGYPEAVLAFGFQGPLEIAEFYWVDGRAITEADRTTFCREWKVPTGATYTEGQGPQAQPKACWTWTFVPLPLPPKKQPKGTKRPAELPEPEPEDDAPPDPGPEQGRLWD